MVATHFAISESGHWSDLATSKSLRRTVDDDGYALRLERFKDELAHSDEPDPSRSVAVRHMQPEHLRGPTGVNQLSQPHTLRITALDLSHVCSRTIADRRRAISASRSCAACW